MSSSAVTVKDIVNKILTRMRESTVGTINSTDQSSAVLRLVNDAKREVEDSWNWDTLRNTISFITQQGTFNYNLANRISVSLAVCFISDLIKNVKTFFAIFYFFKVYLRL